MFNKIMHGQGQAAVLARGSSAAMGVQILGTLLGLAVQVVLARSMSRSAYGSYSYVLTWIYAITVLTLFGFDTGLVRFIAEYLSTRQYGLLRVLWRFVLRVSLIASLAAAALVIAVVYASMGRSSSDLRLVFWIAVLLLPVLTVTRLNESIMRGWKRVVWANLGTSVLRPAVLIAVVGLLLLAGYRRLSPAQAMGLTLIAALAALMVTSIKVRRTIGELPLEKVPQPQVSLWLSVSLPLLLMASIGTVLNRADILILGGLDSAAQVGVYNVVAKTSGLLIFGLTAVNMIAAPMIAEMYARGQRAELQRIVSLAAIGIFVFVFLVGIIMAVFGKWLLSIFGSAYVEGYYALLVLLAAQGVNALCGPVGYLLSMTGRQAIAMKVLFMAAFVNVILNFILIPKLGYLGAALATASAMVLWNLTLLVIVRRQMGIDATIFSFLRLIKS